MGNMDMKSKCYLIKDAQMDILKGLNCLTDMDNPNCEKICCLAKAVKDLQKTLHLMGYEHETETEAEAMLSGKSKI